MSRNGTARGPIGRMNRGRSIIWRVQKARIGEIYWWRSDSMVLKRELWVSRFGLSRFALAPDRSMERSQEWVSRFRFLLPP